MRRNHHELGGRIHHPDGPKRLSAVGHEAAAAGSMQVHQKRPRLRARRVREFQGEVKAEFAMLAQRVDEQAFRLLTPLQPLLTCAQGQVPQPAAADQLVHLDTFDVLIREPHKVPTTHMVDIFDSADLAVQVVSGKSAQLDKGAFPQGLQAVRFNSEERAAQNVG
mmetsp:Transcript_119660/g.235232  ORF Transcript_119660/g.235232 Transcript_119660/m.235232 type:complete len:165 (-) Transcript_119660:157-651(-)